MNANPLKTKAVSIEAGGKAVNDPCREFPGRARKRLWN
jgi:hypothetical protein